MWVARISVALATVLVSHRTLVLVAAMQIYALGRRQTEWLETRTRRRQAATPSVATLIVLIVSAAGETHRLAVTVTAGRSWAGRSTSGTALSRAVHPGGAIHRG